MQGLGDILKSHGPKSSPELQAIKDFVFKEFGENVGVRLASQAIVITTPSAALAGSLRLRLPELEKLAGKRRCIIRIG